MSMTGRQGQDVSLASALLATEPSVAASAARILPKLQACPVQIHRGLTSMDQRESIAEIRLATSRRLSQLEPKLETEAPAQRNDGTLGVGTAQRDNEDENSPKKPLAFKFAFAGLAAAVFVFQIDATTLGIALP
ncbi:MAG: hypothetical protein Q9191_005027, partial [Dirinaria sp. TL-2023a]